MMDEGGYLQECGAGEEESPGMAVTEDHQTSDQNHEDQQDVAFSDNEDSIAEIVDTQDALKMLNSRMNLRQENAVLVSENTALYCHIQSLRQTVNELEDAHAASEEMEITNIISQLKQENESLKVRCENITSEMYSVLYEGKMKTKKILDNLIDLQWAQQQQLEEKHQLALDKKSQDIHEKSMMIEELLATIQELRTNNQEPRLDIQTKSWWRRQRDKVVKGMATFRRCFKFSVGVRTSKRSFNRCNKVHPVNIDVV